MLVPNCKVNMALKGLPTFTCLPKPLGQHYTTTHLLPDEEEVLQKLEEGFRDVEQGCLPDFPAIEWYMHTTIDPSLQDNDGHHNSALFVQWVPYELSGTTWEEQEDRYVEKLLGICDKFAPGITPFKQSLRKVAFSRDQWLYVVVTSSCETDLW